jgi:hypothetical protein
MRGANLVLRFLLELSALAAMVYWGFATASGATQWVLGLGAPLAVAVVWGLFVSPKRRFDLPHPARFAIELVVFAAAVLALFAADQPVLAVVLAGLELVSGTLNYVWAG